MRIFIAVQFSEPARKSVIDCMDSLRRQGVRGNYTRPENLHLTMAFIGETDQPEVAMTVSRLSVMKSERIGGKLVYTEV